MHLQTKESLIFYLQIPLKKFLKTLWWPGSKTPYSVTRHMTTFLQSLTLSKCTAQMHSMRTAHTHTHSDTEANGNDNFSSTETADSCYSFVSFHFFSTIVLSWWRHQMETFPALLAICAGNSPVPAQRPVKRSFDVFFDLRLNKRLSKQSWSWWFETLSRPLWRHRNGHSWWFVRNYLMPNTDPVWGSAATALRQVCRSR